MSRRKLNIEANDNRIDAAARRRKKPLERWLAKATKIMVANELQKLKGKQSLRKAQGDKALEAELLKILVAFGLRDIDLAGQDMNDRLDQGTDWVVSPSLVSQITRQKKVRVTGIMGETLKGIRRDVKAILQQATKEKPRPSISEISRRIRTQVADLKGPTGKADTQSRARRAELIARTEAAQSENTGIQEGMAIAGVAEVEWLAHVDGRSGDRHHERMNGQRITLADSRGNDSSKWFLTPLGNRLRYPADPSGPIEDTAR